MILLIDDCDSFTWGLYQCFCELGAGILVRHNDTLTLEEIAALAPEKIVISPSPYTPNEARISLAAIRHYAGKTPLLGVCLEHQAIAQTFDTTIVRAAWVVHGKTSLTEYDDGGMFQGLNSPLTVTRYHSLVIDLSILPPEFIIITRSASAEIMGVHHHDWNSEGIQFHPEGILSEQGHQLLENSLKRQFSVITN